MGTSISIPDEFNIGEYLLDRHLQEGRNKKIAVYYEDKTYSYEQLYEFANKAGNVLKELGVEIENRVLLCLTDCPELLAFYFGALKIGAVPVPVNTMVTVKDYEYYLNDSRAKVAIIEDFIWEELSDRRDLLRYLQHVIVRGNPGYGSMSLSTLINNASPILHNTKTTCNDMAFWLYSSGTTGTPKGVIHLHHDLPYFMSPFCEEIADMSTNDIAFSSSKMFFSYGRNNSLDSVFLKGASVVLFPDKPTPATILQAIEHYKPTLFYSVPTFYAAILKYVIENNLKPDLTFLRLCFSAGEALPESVWQQWKDVFGLDIIDGIGSSDVGAIYLSNRPHNVRPGSCGKLIPGFDGLLLDEERNEVEEEAIGTLWISNEGTTPGYWNKHAKTKEVIFGEWFCTSDQFWQDSDGFFWYAGRQGDMLKPGGIWMSPLEVENILLKHHAVIECAIIGAKDENGLEKPLSYVVLNKGYEASDELAKELQNHVRSKTANYKCPRWIHFISSLPRTTTGKVQRYKLKYTQ